MAACTNCGKNLGIFERAGGKGKCKDCLKAEDRQRQAEETRALAEEARARMAAAAQERLEASPTYGINLSPSTAAEAKLSIKELRLRKRELQAEKREVTSEMADARAQWRERQAGRHSTAGMGRGTMGRVVRAGVQANRRAERMQNANRVSAIQDSKQGIDDQILEVDRAIVALDRFVHGAA